METELARKDRELQEEKAGKEKALTQLKTMMKVCYSSRPSIVGSWYSFQHQVMKVLKGKYDTEMELKKQMEAEIGALREKVEHPEPRLQHDTGTDSKKKEKRSAKEMEDELKTAKR